MFLTVCSRAADREPHSRIQCSKRHHLAQGSVSSTIDHPPRPTKPDVASSGHGVRGQIGNLFASSSTASPSELIKLVLVETHQNYSPEILDLRIAMHAIESG